MSRTLVSLAVVVIFILSLSAVTGSSAGASAPYHATLPAATARPMMPPAVAPIVVNDLGPLRSALDRVD